jgi:hypothetical protein
MTRFFRRAFSSFLRPFGQLAIDFVLTSVGLSMLWTSSGEFLQ